MEHLCEAKEIVEEEAEESPQVHGGVPSNPTPPTTTRDVSRAGKMGPAASASLGAMRALVWKLDKLLRGSPRGCCSSKRVEDGMRLLKQDVEEISSCLDELSQVEDPPTMAKCWMNEVRDLSYEMEDYADSLFLRPTEDPCLFADNIKTTRSRRKWFRHSRTPKKLTWDEQIEGTLSEFRMYVKDAMKRHEVYGLKFFSTKKCTLPSVGCMLTRPYEKTSDIVISGRMNEFINSVVANGAANQQQLKVVSVLGSACLGKTTIARVLYKKIGKQYDCRAFIRVSKKPNMKRIFRDMLSQLQRQDTPQYYENIDLIDIIKRYLYNKRYLVIIDDVWDASVWDTINRAFPKGTRGSRIVTTTQIEDVAFRCCRYQPEHVFEMKPLDDHHSRKLFFNRLFGSENSCPQQWEEGLNKIVQICGGLPLATITIASLLASQPVITEDLLKRIHESLSSCFMVSSTSERTRQALNLSFNNLPHYLKTCLLYLSIYPEGSIIWRHDLVKQWVAESLIDTTEGKDIEEVAGGYLDQLIGRRFIQPICVNYSSEVLSFAVHDMVHNLIVNKSDEENFIVAIDDSPTNVALSYKTRRLSLLFGDARYAKIPANIGKSQVRSITYYGLSRCMPCFKEFKLLRVLNLQLFCYDCDDDTADLTGISELLQLRYLKIVSDVCIKLPNHVLHCLETLDITDATFSPVPWDVNFPHLLHLHHSLPVDRNPLSEDTTISPSLVSLGKLNYLQELHLTLSSSTTFYHLKSNMEALGYLLGGHGNLKTIALAHVPSVITVHSRRVTTYWHSMEPPPLLQRFEFSLQRFCIFNKIPQCVGKLGNLRILKIAVEELPVDDVDMLRGLPALTDLSLYVRMAPDEKIIFGKAAGFSVLKYFKLRCTIGLVWLQFEADAMPNLWKLKLVFNDIPRKDRRFPLYSTRRGRFEQHQRGTAFITIEHMQGLREISAKFEGAAADVEYALRTGFSNHPSNPIINRPPVDYSCYGGEGSTEEKQQPADEIVEDEPDVYQPDTSIEEEPDEYGKTLDRTGDKSTSSPQKSSSLLHVFTLYELMSATSNFSKENLCEKSRIESYVDKRLFIRTGVYKGSFDGSLRPSLVPPQVAIRCLDMSYISDDRKWLTDLEYLGRARHPHIVEPVGFCQGKNYIMLVYEYMPEGSLSTHLLENHRSSLPWLTRLKIALGAAKGLAFLHQADKPMVHGDFKTSNVLLDKDFTAKLSGYGPRRDRPQGYTAESDVYNFGLVLLELLVGRPAINEEPGPYTEDSLHHIMDRNLKGIYSGRAAWSAATTARRCLEKRARTRPSMRDVIEALEPLLQLGDVDRPTLASESSSSVTSPLHLSTDKAPRRGHRSFSYLRGLLHASGRRE